MLPRSVKTYLNYSREKKDYDDVIQVSYNLPKTSVGLKKIKKLEFC